METQREEQKKKRVPFFSSLQVKYAASYLVIFAVVLVLLNTYPVIVSQDLLFTSKRDSLKSQTAVIASALMELETLSSDQVVRVMNMLDNMGLTQILVTDPAGLILYDSTRDTEGEDETEPEQQEYRYALYQEVALALRGRDVFYSRFSEDRFISSAASPIVYRGMVIGSVYILEEDADPGGAAAQPAAEPAHHLPGHRRSYAGDERPVFQNAHRPHRGPAARHPHRGRGGVRTPAPAGGPG